MHAFPGWIVFCTRFVNQAKTSSKKLSLIAIYIAAEFAGQHAHPSLKDLKKHDTQVKKIIKYLV
jgi:hypothetical protein